MKQLKVLMLTSSYPRHSRDNSSVFLRNLAESVAEKNIEVSVLAPDHMEVDREKGFSGKIKLHHFRYFPRRMQTLAYGSGILPNIRNNPVIALQVPFFILSMMFMLIVLCIRVKPDVIHAHWVIPQGLIAVIVGTMLRIPVITTAHGADAYALNSGILERIKKFVLARSKYWTANTRATAEAIQQKRSGLHIIPMGVDVRRFSSGIRNRLRAVDDQKSIILFVGRLVEKKGVKYLIEAFSKLPDKKRSKTLLWIVGDGNELPSLKKLAEENDLTKQVIFFGDIDNNELPDYYAAADIFVAPSVVDSLGDTEGQGVVLIEALASKTAIISTRVGGINEVVTDHTTGIVVEPRQSEELANSINSLLNDAVLREGLANNGYLHAKNNYAWPQIADRFISLYTSVKHTLQ